LLRPLGEEEVSPGHFHLQEVSPGYFARSENNLIAYVKLIVLNILCDYIYDKSFYLCNPVHVLCIGFKLFYIQ